MTSTIVCPACGQKKEYFLTVCIPCYRNRHEKPEVLRILDEVKP